MDMELPFCSRDDGNVGGRCCRRSGTLRAAAGSDGTFLRGGTKTKSEVQQVHVSLAGPKHMRVSWMSTVYAKNKSPFVEYGLTSENYTFTAVGTSLGSYSFLLYESGTMNHVVVGPLQDNTTYYYKCDGADA